MAMNDISVSISADKESFLAFKDSSLADSADESGTEFFTQLQDAHTTFEPIKKDYKAITLFTKIFYKKKQMTSTNSTKINLFSFNDIYELIPNKDNIGGLAEINVIL